MPIDMSRVAQILKIEKDVAEKRLELWKAANKSAEVKVDLKLMSALSGFSVTSISNIINKKQGSASKETREKIQALAAYLNYIPLTSARLLNSTKKRSVAFVAPITRGSSTDFYIELLKGVQETARKFHYSIAIYDISFEEEKDFYKKMPFWGMVDGIISVSSTVEQKDVLALCEKNIPLVHINPRNRLFDLPVTHSIETSYEGFGSILDHVLAAGGCKKPVVIVANPEKYYQRKELVCIFEQKLQEYGIAFFYNQNVIETPSYLIQDSISCIKNLFSSERKFDAVFCLSDMVAVAVIAECGKRGLRIPVVGYANLPIASLFDATTVDERLQLLGQTAFEKMIITLDQLEVNKYLPAPSRTVIPTVPVIRGSCLTKAGDRRKD